MTLFRKVTATVKKKIDTFPLKKEQRVLVEASNLNPYAARDYHLVSECVHSSTDDPLFLKA